MYIYQVNIMVQSEEDVAVESMIDDAVKQVCSSNTNISHISSSIVEMDHNDLWKCHICGQWVYIGKNRQNLFFSNGTIIDGSIYCDLCVPPQDHCAF